MINVDSRLLARRERLSPHRPLSRARFTLLVMARQMWRSKARFLSVTSSTFFGVTAAAAALSVTGAESQFEYSLQFAAVACLIVGIVTIQQSVHVAAVEAEQDYRLLLASGFDPGTITAIVIGQSAVASLLGSIGGAIVGWVVAVALAPLLAAQNIEGFDMIRAECRPVALAAVVLGGVATAVIASLAPARDAAREQFSTDETAAERRRVFFCVIGAAAMLGGVASTVLTWGRTGSLTWTTIVAECLLIVGGLYAAWPMLFRLSAKAIGFVLRLIPGVRRSPSWTIAFRSLTRRPTAAVSVSAAFMVGLLFLSSVTIVGSMQSTADQRARVDSYLADSQIRVRDSYGSKFREKDIKAWSREPGVDDVLVLSARMAHGLPARQGKNYDVIVYTVKGNPFDGTIVEDEAASAAWSRGLLVVGEKDAAKYGLSVGSELSLPSRTDPSKRFYYVVGAVTSEEFFSTGILIPWNQSDYHDPTSAYLVRTPAARAGESNKAFNERMSAKYPGYSFLDRSDVASKGSLTAMYSLLVYYGAGSLVITVSLFGLLTMMTLAVMQRRREMGLLAAAGMSSGQLKGSLWAEAFILSLASGVYGVVIGCVVGSLVGYKLLGTTMSLPPSTLFLEFWLVVATIVVGVVSAMPGGVVAARGGAKMIRDE